MTVSDYLRLAMEFPTLALALYTVRMFGIELRGLRSELTGLHSAIFYAVTGRPYVPPNGGVTEHPVQHGRERRS